MSATITCPGCGAALTKAAREGGLVLRNRYLLLKAGQPPIVGCVECGHQVTVTLPTLMLLVRPVAAPTR